MKSGKVLLGVLAGVAAGAILGILFAPDKGTNTRKKILSKGEDYADGLKEKFDEMVGNITKKSENIRQEGKEIVSKGKVKYEEMKNEVLNSVG